MPAANNEAGLMLNILIPMAGRGSRFAEAGYTDPKPLIPVKGVPMIGLVIRNLTPSVEHRFIFVCQRSHLEDYGFDAQIALWTGNHEIIAIDGITEGAACTALLARDLIDSDDPLMIANSDQYVDILIDDYLAAMEDGADGLIMTMTANDPKWSFAAIDPYGHVTEVAEKVPISDEATVGIYNFARGKDFVAGADQMIASDKRVNGEFYVAPVYNELISDGAKIRIHNIGSEADGMYGLGIPQDLDLFLSLPVSDRAVSFVQC